MPIDKIIQFLFTVGLCGAIGALFGIAFAKLILIPTTLGGY